MIHDLLSITNLLIALGAVVLGIVLYVAIVKLRVRTLKTTDTDDSRKSSKGRPNSQFSISELLEIRLSKGLADSEPYANQFAGKLVADIANRGEFFSREELGTMEAKLRFLEEYRLTFSQQEFQKDHEVANEFIERALSFASEQESGVASVYRFLKGLSERLVEPDFLVLVKFVADHPSKLNNLSFEDDSGKLLNGVLKKLHECAKKNYAAILGDKKARLEAIEMFSRTLKDSIEDFTDLRLRSQGEHAESSLLEITYLDDLLNKILEIVKSTEIEWADKPVFNVELMEQGNAIEINSELVALTFRVINKKHESIQLERDVHVCPRVKSNDLKYLADSKKLDLRKGSNLVEFVFHSFYMNKTDFDKNPEVVFNIHYFLKDSEHDVNVSYTLPDISPTFRVENPFKEGKAGKGLPGSSGLFVGRRELLSKIASNLLDMQTAPIYFLIVGLPRIGKSSVLNQLAQNPIWLKEKYLPLFVDSQITQEPVEFFASLFTYLESKIRELGIHVRTPVISDKSSKRTFVPILELLRLNEKGIRGSGKRLLMLFDEYQQLTEWDEFSSSPNLPLIARDVAYQIPAFIKALRDQYDGIVAVTLSGYKTFDEVDPHWVQQLGGRVTQESIGRLSESDVRELVGRTFGRYSIEMPEASLKHLMFLCNRHPFLLIVLSYWIFELLIEDGNSTPGHVISIEEINASVHKVILEDLRFIWFDPWIIDDTKAKILLACMAALSHRVTVQEKIITQMPFVSTRDVRDYLFHNYDVPYTQFETFDDSFNTLRAHEIVEKQENGDGYRLRYPVFAIVAHYNSLLSKEIHSLRKGQ